MALGPEVITTLRVTDWRHGLPRLASSDVDLRELALADAPALHRLLASDSSPRFGLESPVSLMHVRGLVARAVSDRAAGLGLSYAVSDAGVDEPVGLFQVRPLDVAFETAEWDFAIAPARRGGTLFVEAARLVAGFLFETVGVYRLEARVAVQNGRGNGAMRKLGAVQEGMLRRGARQHGVYVDQVLWALLKDDWRQTPRPTGEPHVH